MKAAKIREIFERFKANNEKPTTELIFYNHFQLVIAVMLSAQTTDANVNKATTPLFKVATTPEEMLAIGEEKLLDYLKSLNLYKTKTRNVLKTSKILLEEHNSIVPNSREALEALPGVGRKTANVVLNCAFGEPTMAVDTHIFRISNRIGIAPGKDVLAVEKNLLKKIPKEFMQDAHHWLILHGRYVCVARKPKCEGCLINDLCEFKDKRLSE